ncbi:MAG: TolC family protein [Bacteroidetes bacterium]|nr:TolC family protein [Bacteroidota bacterium]MBS1935300.1 TolC family protein [Bacteroidota bacterium]
MQTIKAVLFSGIVLFAILHCQAQDTVTNIGSTLTIQQCVDIAIKNNLQVRQSEITMLLNGVAFNQSKDNLLPQINGNASQGINFGRSINPYTNQYIDEQINTGNYGLNAGLVLFNGLSLQSAIKQNRYAYEASKLDWQQQKDNITLNVLLSYLQVLSSQELLEVSRKQAEIDSSQLNRLINMNKEGAVTPLSNLSDLQGQYAADLGGIVTAVNNLETAKITLFQYMNIRYKKDVQYEKIPLDLFAPDDNTNSDSIFQTALTVIPSIKSVDLKVKSYQNSVKYYRGQYYPTLSVYGSLSSNYSSAATSTIYGANVPVASDSYVTVGGTNYPVFVQQPSSSTTSKIAFSDQFKNNRYTQVGLQLSVPILNYLRTRNNVKQAKINLKNAEITATSTRNQLQQNVEQAYQNQLAAYGQYRSYQDQSKAYGESFRITEIRFNEGVITSDVYVLAKNRLDQANVNLIASKYNYIFRSKILDYYRGALRW